MVKNSEKTMLQTPPFVILAVLH